jgi:Flp pilus assembly protein TadD
MLARAHLVHTLVVAQQKERAWEEAMRALEIDSSFAPIHANIAYLLILRGDPDSAVRVLDRYTSSTYPLVAWTYAAAGRRGPARRALDSLLTLRRSRPVDATELAILYIAVGDTSAALKSLEDAYVDRQAGLAYVLGDGEPMFDGLRGHVRFRQLRLRAGFPH